MAKTICRYYQVLYIDGNSIVGDAPPSFASCVHAIAVSYCREYSIVSSSVQYRITVGTVYYRRAYSIVSSSVQYCIAVGAVSCRRPCIIMSSSVQIVVGKVSYRIVSSSVQHYSVLGTPVRYRRRYGMASSSVPIACRRKKLLWWHRH